MEKKVTEDTINIKDLDLDDFDLSEDDILKMQEKDKKKNSEDTTVVIKEASEDETAENSSSKKKEPDDMLEKKSFGKRFIEGIPNLLIYFIIFGLSIAVWELIIRFQISDTITKRNLFFIVFVPAEAMLLTFFCGFFKNKLVNKIIFLLLELLVSIYYMVQLVYLKNFGSLLSISMTGMGGDAVGNFGWAVVDSIKASVGLLLLILVPVIIIGALIFVIKSSCGQYHILWHFIALGLVVGLWFLGILGLKIGGTDRQSAYYAYHNVLADTDTTANRLGTLTTSILESGSYFFGIKTGDSNDALAQIDDTALTLAPAPVVVEEVVSDNQPEDEGAEEEIIEEETFVSEPYVYENIDFASLKEIAPDADTKALCEYFENRTPTATNKYTGMFKDYNLIYICAESFWSYACDPDVTPTLYKMANNGIVLNNYYNSFKNTTTNGEYAFSTSLWPDVSRDAACGTAVGSFAQSVSKFMPFGMGKMFAANGYTTYGYHNYDGYYYRRSYSWPNLGYENLKFMGQGMHFTSSWPSSDFEMMEQSVDDYIDQDHFLAYYMTFSGHGPFTSANVMYNRNVKTVKERLGDRQYTDNAMGYFAGELELDKAMEYLLQRLDEAGKLDNTVIVMTSDHYPYYLTNDGRDSLVGYKPDENFEIYESTCMIYNAAMEKMEVDTYCCNVDIMPTMYNLFGIDFDSRLLMGTDIFSEGNHKAQLYNQSFVTEVVRYNAETGEEEWFGDLSGYSPVDLDRYLDAQIASSEGTYAAAIKLLANNFYLFVWQNSGLIADDDLKAEVKREKDAELRADDELAESAALAWVQMAASLGGSIDPLTGNIVNENGEVIMLQAEMGNVVGAVATPEQINVQSIIQAQAAAQAAAEAAAVQAAMEAAAQQAAAEQQAPQ